MTQLYLLEHFKIGPDDECNDNVPDIKQIGIYSTLENAQAAIARLSKKTGFRDWPNGFRIDAKTLNQDRWSEGFIEADAVDPTQDKDLSTCR